MADPSHYPDSDDPSADVGRRAASAASRWLMLAGVVIAIVLLLLVIALHLTGVIGPGLHG